MRRINKLRQELTINKLDAFIVHDSLNRRYISGFTGSAGSLLVTHNECFLITDFRYTQQAKKETRHFLR